MFYTQSNRQGNLEATVGNWHGWICGSNQCDPSATDGSGRARGTYQSAGEVAIQYRYTLAMHLRRTNARRYSRSRSVTFGLRLLFRSDTLESN